MPLFSGEFLVARCICEDGWKPSHFTDAVLVFPGYQEEQFLLIFLVERVFSITVKQEFERGRRFFCRLLLRCFPKIQLLRREKKGKKDPPSLFVKAKREWFLVGKLRNEALPPEQRDFPDFLEMNSQLEVLMYDLRSFLDRIQLFSRGL